MIADEFSMKVFLFVYFCFAFLGLVTSSFSGVGCLETCVMKVLIRHLKVASLNRREDTLAALKVALQAWSTTPSFEVMYQNV